MEYRTVISTRERELLESGQQIVIQVRKTYMPGDKVQCTVVSALDFELTAEVVQVNTGLSLNTVRLRMVTVKPGHQA